MLLALPYVWWVGRPRRPTRRRGLASLGVRTLLLLALVLALANLTARQNSQRLAVVFLLDASDSLDAEARAAQQTFLAQALAQKPVDALWAGVVFGANALVFQSPTTQAEPPQTLPRVQAGESDLASALTLGLALAPSDASTRLVLLSDGNQTRGDLLAVARRAAALGVTLDVLPLVRPQTADVRLLEVGLPSRVLPEQAFDLTLTLAADAPTRAQVLVSRDGELLEQASLTLQAGENRYTLPQQAAGAGFLRYRVQVLAADDPIPQNNRLDAVTQVVGRARLLLVTEDDNAAALARLLQAGGYDVRVARPAAMSSDPLVLAAYESIVVANVPATSWTMPQMRALQTAVEALGVGAVFVGGDRSYALGGYANTPLEELLPLAMTLRDPQRLPQLTLAYVIDTSGSMNTSDDGALTYLQLGQIAMDTSLELLQPTDRAAIVTFDSVGRWVARLQDRADKRELQRLIRGMTSGGGTDVLGALRLVTQELAADDAPLKHVILLTDGGASGRGLAEQGAAMARAGITLSVIVIGRAPPDFMRPLAEANGGNYYEVRDAQQIPRIFAQETVLASRSYLAEGTFTPMLAARHPIMTGITSVPPLLGYVVTSPKDTAQMLLVVGEYDDPLLAAWQFGLGRVVAFTSDTGAWAQAWQAWTDAGQFWGQAVSWTQPPPSDALRVTLTAQGDGLRVDVEAQVADGTFLNGLSLTGTLLAPDGSTTRATFQQTNIGSYAAVFAASQEGVYLFTVEGYDAQGTAYRSLAGWARTYSREYLPQTGGAARLAAAAAVTGGRVLDDADIVFAPPLRTVLADVPLWQALVGLALLLLPLDVAIRRLLISERDLTRLWTRLTPHSRPFSQQAKGDGVREGHGEDTVRALLDKKRGSSR